MTLSLIATIFAIDPPSKNVLPPFLAEGRDNSVNIPTVLVTQKPFVYKPAVQIVTKKPFVYNQYTQKPYQQPIVHQAYRPVPFATQKPYAYRPVAAQQAYAYKPQSSSQGDDGSYRPTGDNGSYSSSRYQ